MKAKFICISTALLNTPMLQLVEKHRLPVVIENVTGELAVDEAPTGCIIEEPTPDLVVYKLLTII